MKFDRENYTPICVLPVVSKIHGQFANGKTPLNNYSAMSDRRQQHISTVLSGRGESSTSVATSSSPKVTVDEITSVSTIQPGRSAGTLPFLYQCRVGTVNIFANSQNPKGGDFEKTHQFKRRRIVIDSTDESQ